MIDMRMARCTTLHTIHMGVTAENIAAKWGHQPRSRQDALAG
jgi:acetyl-CoA acetyltransferase